MRFSLVIPTYDRKESLSLCLSSAIDQDYPDYEVIVVDDASPDDPGDVIRQRFPQVRFFRQEANRGPAAARNRGIREATGDVIAFTDDDCVLPSDYLSRLAEGYARYPEAAGAGGYAEAPTESQRTNVFARYDAYWIHRVNHAGPEPYLGGHECPAGGGASISYRRDVLEAVEGFDETFRTAEDPDLKWRVVEKGGKMLYLPIKVTHLCFPSTLRAFWHQRQNYGRGAIRFERKHRGGPPSAFRLVLRGGVRAARWFRDVFRAGPGIATAQLIGEMADLTGEWLEVRHPQFR